MPTSKTAVYSTRVKVWLYPGPTPWHFVSLPKKMSTEIKIRFAFQERGWGSHRVQATIGSTSWKTSIFPDKKSGCYVLPLKAEVRKKEGVAVGKTVALSLEILE